MRRIGTYVDDLQLITGINIPLKELKLEIRQPTIPEVAMLTEEKYFLALSLFRANKKTLGIDKEEVTNWMIFKETLEQKIEGIENPKVFIINFLRLFVPKINMGPRSLMIDIGEEIVNIEEENFDLFQQVVCEVGAAFLLGKHEGEDFNPVNEHAAAIAEKMKAGRKRVAALKALEGNIDESKGFLMKYVKAVATMTANSLEDVKKMTIFQLNEIVQTYLAWEGYDLDVKGRLAGAKGDAKLVHWMMRHDQNETTIGTL